MAEAADETQKNNVAVTDEVGKTILEKQREALNRELAQFTKSLEEVRKNRERYTEMVEIDKEVWAMRLDPKQAAKKDAHRVFVYEDNPRFWELVLKKAKFQYEEDMARAEGMFKSFDAQEKMQLEQVESSKKKLAEIEAN